MDPTDWTEERKAGFYFNLNRVRSQQILLDGNYDATNYREVYRLTLAAYGNERMAREARMRAMEAMVDAKCKR